VRASRRRREVPEHRRFPRGAQLSSTNAGPPRRRGVLSTSEGTHRGDFTALDWALFASIGGIWGASFLFIAIGLEAFEPGLITWGRVLCGAAVLLLVPGARIRIEREDRPRLIALSVLWVAIPFTLFPIAEQHVTSGLVGLLNGALPIVAAVIGSLMLRRVPDRSRLVGLAIGFAGVATIALPAAFAGSSEALGVVLALAAVACYGVAINISAPLTQRYGSLPVMANMLALASLWTAPFGIWGLRRSSFAWDSFAAVVVLGAFGTGIAFVLMGRLVARVGSTRAAFATYLIPVVAVILGAVFRHEEVRATSVIGMALVIGGAILASRPETPSPRRR
jgi:drug/metabolite transporter (DMT)-like permease